MKRYIQQSISAIVTACMLFSTVPNVSIAATQAQQGADQSNGPEVHYYIFSNNSPAGTLHSGKFTGLAYADYGKQAPASASGVQAGAANAPNESFGWQQEYRDTAMGFTYLRARYYQPDIKSFMSMDSYSLDNKYVYGYANPIGFIDPSGHMGVFNYILNGAVIVVSAALMVPTGGASFAWDIPTIAAATGGVSGVLGVGAQAAYDVGQGELSDVLVDVSFFVGLVGAAADLMAGSVKAWQWYKAKNTNLIKEMGAHTKYLEDIESGKKMVTPGELNNVHGKFLEDNISKIEKSANKTVNESYKRMNIMKYAADKKVTPVSLSIQTTENFNFNKEIMSEEFKSVTE